MEGQGADVGALQTSPLSVGALQGFEVSIDIPIDLVNLPLNLYN